MMLVRKVEDRWSNKKWPVAWEDVGVYSVKNWERYDGRRVTEEGNLILLQNYIIYIKEVCKLSEDLKREIVFKTVMKLFSFFRTYRRARYSEKELSIEVKAIIIYSPNKNETT